MTEKRYVSWNDFNGLTNSIVRQIQVQKFNPDVVIGPGRGGYIPGVMLSHYFEVPFEGFDWQTRDGKIEDSSKLISILYKYTGKNILVVDDINDTGTTLLGIDKIVQENDRLFLHGDVKYATIFEKLSSNFGEVDFIGEEISPENDKWIVFPYEEWWI